MNRSRAFSLAFASLAFMAALLPVTSGEVLDDRLVFYLDVGSTTQGKLVLGDPPLTDAAATVSRAGAPATSVTHSWQAANRPGNMTVTGDLTLVAFVATGSGALPLGNPGDTAHGPQMFWLRAKAFFGVNQSAFAWAEVPTGAGPHELSLTLPFTAGYPMHALPDEIVRVETTVFAFQPTGTHHTYAVNGTATPSRLEVPGAIEGLEPTGGGGVDDNRTANMTDPSLGNETGNGTGNETGNGTDEPSVQANGTSKGKKKEGFLPGFELVPVLLGVLVAAAVAGRRRRMRGGAP